MSRSHAYSKVLASSGGGSTVKSQSSPSEAGGAAGDQAQHIGAWNEKNSARFSGTTAYGGGGGGGWGGNAPVSPRVGSPELTGGLFVGYNRQTGAPEFVSEAPVQSEAQERGHWSEGVEGVLRPAELDAGGARK